MAKITIILPCAGAGTRMGLNTPKELYDITPNKKLIDFSLAHIRDFAEKELLMVAVVIRPWKLEVAEYVAEQLPGITVEAVMFNDDYREWPGSVYSAQPVFSQNNLVLLPDSCLEVKHLVISMTEALQRYNLVFGYRHCTDEHTLAGMGAMGVKNGEVRAFQDKPVGDYQLYNGFWGCYGFKEEMGKEVYDFLIASVNHQRVSLGDELFQPVGTIPIDDYYDLGTWKRIEIFRSKL